MSAPIRVTVLCQGVTYRRVYVHGAGGLLTCPKRFRAMVARPDRHASLRVYTSWSALEHETRDLPMSGVKVLRVEADRQAATRAAS